MPDKYWNQWQRIGLSQDFMYKNKPEMFETKTADDTKFNLKYQTRANLPLVDKNISSCITLLSIRKRRSYWLEIS